MAKITQTIEILQQKDIKALRAELAETQVSLQKARVNLAFGRLPKTSDVGFKRKHIARLQTVLTQKEKEASNA